MKEKLTIELAEHIIGINIEKSCHKDIAKNYELFLSPNQPEILIDVELSPDIPPVNNSKVGLKFSNNLISIIDDYLIGSYDFGRKYGKLNLNPQNFLYPLGTYLRNLTTLLAVLIDRGIALHAACILKEGKAFIFIGPSGAGKTTVSKLSHHMTTLSDDLVIIKKVNGKFKVFPTPYWGDKQTGERQNIPYGISSIYKLIKDNKVYIEAISYGQALADMLTMPHIPPGALGFDKMLLSFSELISQVPYYGLHFKPEPSFWNCICKIKYQKSNSSVPSKM